MYDKYKWDPRPEGNVERLYEDYRQINSYLINKYNMQSDILVPDDFEKEDKLFIQNRKSTEASCFALCRLNQ